MRTRGFDPVVAVAATTLLLQTPSADTSTNPATLALHKPDRETIVDLEEQVPELLKQATVLCAEPQDGLSVLALKRRKSGKLCRLHAFLLYQHLEPLAHALRENQGFQL